MKTALIKGLFVSFFLLLIMPYAISCEHGDAADLSVHASYRMRLNLRVKQFVKSYIQSNRTTLSNIKKRSQAPFTIADSVLTHYSLPSQLKYLEVIESELKPSAVSRVGAVGPWQLMPATARILGLKITHARDERMLYGKSTTAAARYLKDLYAEYGDWLLVLAAYNGGEGPVNHAIHASGSHNFWQLQAYLPAESRGHVKKFIATLYYFEGQSSMTQFASL